MSKKRSYGELVNMEMCQLLDFDDYVSVHIRRVDKGSSELLRFGTMIEARK